MEYSAMISNCNKYRYKLTRTWNEDEGKVLFIMLNPSTADEKTDDLTTKRCINFAKKWGYGGIMIGNIYPFRAKRPKDLKKWLNTPDNGLWEHREGNIDAVHQMAEQAEQVVCAWGCNHPGIPDWIEELKQKLGTDLLFLELCKDDITPKHPLGNISKHTFPASYSGYTPW